MKNAVAIVIVLILLLVGGYFLMKSKGTLPNTANVAVGTNLNPTTGNVFTSIKDALSKSMTLQCDYKNEQGVQTTTYIKGGAVRVVMAGTTDTKQPGNVLLKDKKMYMWNDVSKTGFTFTMTVPSVSPGTAGTASGQPTSLDQQASVLATIEKYKNACKTGVVADSFFQVPTDIKFQDMNAFTQQMKQVPTQATGGQSPTNY